MTVISSTAYNNFSPFLEPTNNNLFNYHASTTTTTNNNNINIINSSNLLNQPTSNNFKQEKRDRQISADIAGAETAGCCLIKTLISNVLTFATRSRRKADLNQRESRTDANYSDNSSSAINSGMGVSTTMGNVMLTTCSNKKSGLINCSKVSSVKVTRKKVSNQLSAELGFADSFDDEVIDKICTLPPRLDRNEWLATHVLDLFDQVNVLCGTISEVCTPVTCPTMNYPGVSKASWIDERGKRHNYSAMRYIDSVMSFCEASRTNQQLFPTKFGITFGPNFEGHCRRMIRYLWHCCGHLYSKHWDLLCFLNLRPQYGLVLSHLARISRMYKLLDAKEVVAIHYTLQLVRPIPQLEPTDESLSVPSPSDKQTEKQRPAKRLNSSDYNEYSTNTEPNVFSSELSNSSSRAKIAAAVNDKTPISLSSIFWQAQPDSATNFNYCNGIFPISAMKSGSWGGHSAIIETNVSSESANSDGCCCTSTTTNDSRIKSFAQMC